jgi:hypothetical protein
MGQPLLSPYTFAAVLSVLKILSVPGVDSCTPEPNVYQPLYDPPKSSNPGLVNSWGPAAIAGEPIANITTAAKARDDIKFFHFICLGLLCEM